MSTLVPPKNSTPQVFSAGKSGVWGLSFWTIMAMHGASLPRRRSCAGILQQSLSTDEPRKGRNSYLRLRPRSAFGSFGVVLMSCKVNFHIVRSALQISVCLPTNPTSGAGTRDEPLRTSSSTSFPGFSPTRGAGVCEFASLSTANDPKMDRKWSLTVNDPQPGPQMIPNKKIGLNLADHRVLRLLEK